MIPQEITVLILLLCEAPKGELDIIIVNKLKKLTSTDITMKEIEIALESIINECNKHSLASRFTMTALLELEKSVKQENASKWKNTIH